MRMTRLLVTAAAAVTLSAGWIVLATTPVATSIQPASGVVDTETPIALTGHDFVPGMRLALVAGGGHEVLHLPLSGVISIALAGDFAFVATDPDLVTLDLSRPGPPAVVGSTPIGGRPGYLRAADRRVFAGVYGAGGFSRLRIFDAADPLLLSPIGDLAFDAPVTQFGYASGFLYLPSAADGFDVVDVRDAAAPVIVACFREVGFQVAAIEVVGLQAFVAGTYRSIDGALYPFVDIFDVSLPFAPQRVASASLPGTVGQLAPIAHGVLVSHSHGLFAVTYDGRYPTRQVALRQGGSTPSFVTTDGNQAAWYHGAVELLDITDPFAPVVRGRFPVTPDEPPVGAPLALRNGLAYWGLSRGLEVYDACEPYAAAPVHERAHRWGLRDVDFTGDRVHFLDDSGQLHVTELIDPAAPHAVGSTLDVSFGDRVAVDGGMAYVAGQTWSWYDRGVLSIIDEEASFVMPVVGSVGLAAPPAAIDAEGALVYIGGWSALWGGSLEIVDATRPREPLPAGRLDGLARPRTLTAAGGALYYFGDDTLTLVDVRDPARPVVAGTLPGFGWPTDSARVGDLLFVSAIVPWTDDAGTLRVLDISSPFSPAVVAEVPISGFPLGVDASATQVVVATDREGVLVFRLDLGMPPRLTQSLADTGGWVGLFDGFASVHRPGTWTIYRLNPPVENTSSASDTCGSSIIPAGVQRGLYDVVTTCPHGHAFRFRDAYRACIRHEFSAGLEAVPRPGLPLLWRLGLAGDEHFFVPRPSHDARLLLPQLPANLDKRYEIGGAPGTLSIVLALTPGQGTGVVHLVGSDRAALESLWATMSATGGIALRALDDRHYGDLQLSIGGGGIAGIDGRPQLSYAYTFSKGILAAASASGPGVDLLFEAEGFDDIRCATPATASYGAGLKRACETNLRGTAGCAW